MRGRLFLWIVSTFGTLSLAGCDRGPPATPTTPATQASARRIALIAVPLSVVAPPTWDVRRGPGGKLVLSGRTPSGDREIALAVGTPVPTFDLPATQPATAVAPGGPIVVRVDDRDGMRVVDRVERVGPTDQPAEVAPVRWTVRFIVLGDGIDQPAYDLSVANLTQLGFERDEAALRAILDTVRPASAADPAAAP